MEGGPPLTVSRFPREITRVYRVPSTLYRFTAAATFASPVKAPDFLHSRFDRDRASEREREREKRKSRDNV